MPDKLLNFTICSSILYSLSFDKMSENFSLEMANQCSYFECTVRFIILSVASEMKVFGEFGQNDFEPWCIESQNFQ